MPNIQVIDGAQNCTYDVFEIAEVDFREIFPSDGQDVEFIEDFEARAGRDRAALLLSRVWDRRIDKKRVMGIHGTLFYELREIKKRFYPTKREAEMSTGH